MNSAAPEHLHLLRPGRPRCGVTLRRSSASSPTTFERATFLRWKRKGKSPAHSGSIGELFGAEATALPLDAERRHSEEALAAELGALGYPGYAHLAGSLRNPAEFLLDALDRSDLDVRTTEGLPWVVLRYPHLDWPWLLREVKLRNRQNRLGFVVSLVKGAALQNGPLAVLTSLEPVLSQLEDARLAKEDTLCQESWPPSRKQHARERRSNLAAHWKLDTLITGADLTHYHG